MDEKGLNGPTLSQIRDIFDNNSYNTDDGDGKAMSEHR